MASQQTTVGLSKKDKAQGSVELLLSDDGRIVIYDFTLDGVLDQLKAMMAEMGIEISEIDFESWCG